MTGPTMIAQVATPTIRVPGSLAELDQWIVWRYEQRDGGKPTKVPYQINGSHASSTDTKTWCSWDEALKAWQEHPRRWSGAGFVFSPGDPFFGIDLDQCLDAAGKLKPWAQPIMARFFDSYAEISPGGRGIKIWGKGRLPGGGAAFPLGDGRVEIYDQARYFTVTGNHWAGQMLDVEEHQAALDWLLALSPHGQKKVPFTLAEGKIPKGSQHDTLVSIAGTMRARGCEYPEIEAALFEINRSRLEEPAPEENIKRIAGSVCKYAPGDKRGIGGADRDLKDRGDEIPTPATVQWPAPIDEAAYYGLAGDIVRTLEPQTEADPVALLIHVLVGVGNLGGRTPHFRVGGASHYTNENAICVGKTSSARKGTAKSDTFNLLYPVDPIWVENHVMAGLSSGEGLIWAVRDEIEKQEPIRDKKKTITGYQTVIADKGVADKRLLVIEPEFASVLRVAGRDGNTLSTVYRQAWDSGLLRVLNKNSPVKATGAHISIIGHITRDELLMELSNNDKVNGFGNRNLWLCVQRSKFLPDGGEQGTLIRATLRRDKALKLPLPPSPGRPYSAEEKFRMLEEAQKLRTPQMRAALALDLNTGLRDKELREIRWEQIDLIQKKALTVGKSKSEAGTGRVIPLNETAIAALEAHAAWYTRRFGECRPEWFVFAFGKPLPKDPTRPITSFKTAWSKVRQKAGVKGRWHDNRHTLVTELSESGAGDEVIMSIAGHVSRAMLSRYSHVRMEAKRRALDEIAARQRTADEKRQQEIERQQHTAMVPN